MGEVTVTTTSWDAERAGAVIAAHGAVPGALLPMLHALQESFGYIDDRAVPLLADALNLSRAEIEGVVGFYHDFRRSHPGRHVVKVCVAEACQARGSAAVVAGLVERLRIGLNQTDSTGSFSLDAVYCLGNCALGPSALVDGELIGRLSPDGLDRVLAGMVEAGQ